MEINWTYQGFTQSLRLYTVRFHRRLCRTYRHREQVFRFFVYLRCYFRPEYFYKHLFCLNEIFIAALAVLQCIGTAPRPTPQSLLVYWCPDMTLTTARPLRFDLQRTWNFDQPEGDILILVIPTQVHWGKSEGKCMNLLKVLVFHRNIRSHVLKGK